MLLTMDTDSVCDSLELQIPQTKSEEGEKVDTCTSSPPTCSASESGLKNDAQNEDTGNKTKSRKTSFVYCCSYPNCEKEFSRKRGLDRHHRKHTNERPFICTIGDCEKSFACKLYLMKHMKRPHDNTDNQKKEKKVHKCEECGKIFKHKFDLKTHLGVHGGEKPFKCDICNETFALRARLKKHMKRHDGYPCQTENCNFVADSWSSLQKHISLEHRKLYSCELCDRQYYSAHKLRSHSAVHEEKKYQCTYDGCGRSYSRQYNLRVHIEAVHSNNTFKCEYSDCDHEAHYKASNIRHMKAHQQKSMNRTAKKANLGSSKSMAAVLSQFEITKEQNCQLLRGEVLEESEVHES